jgi:para-aminobenzoate synthetase component 1
VADPVATLTTQDNQTYVWQQQGPSHYTQDNPFQLVRKWLTHYRPANCQLPDAIPFAGGALGYFSYDLGRYQEQLSNCQPADLKIPDMNIGIYLWALINDHQQKTTTLSTLDPALVQTHYWQQLTTSLLTAIEQPIQTKQANHFQLTSEFQADFSRHSYGQAFRQVMDYIQAGDCYQVNLAQRFQAAFQGSVWQAYLRLRQTNPNPFSAFLNYPQGQILSLSPERFLQVKTGQVGSYPIKGSRPRHKKPALDQQAAQALLTSTKDRAENIMIVDLMRHDLSKNCRPHSVKVSELCGLTSFARVHHLISCINGKLKSTRDSIQLLADCFPGGSITGAPKIRAMEIIEQLEPRRRSVYCGSIGYTGFNGDMDTNICIRTLVAYHQRLYAWAGGGLVADSQEAAEYQETLDKIQPLLQSLNSTC